MRPRGQRWRPGPGLAAAAVAVAVATVASVAAGPLRAQAPSAPPPPSFSGSAQVVSVEVPVQVVKGGEPVRGLTAADFEVWEGRRRLTVTGFETLDASGVPAAGAELPPASARRHFLFLFDLAFSQPKAIVRARAAAAGLLGRLQPTDLAAIATYSAQRGPQLVLGFTADRRQLDNALATLGLPDLMARPVDPLRLVLEQVLGAGNTAAGGAPRVIRDPLAETTDAATNIRLDAVTDAVERADRATERNHINNFSRSLADLARQMSVVEGRKYLVFLSEGFDSTLIQGSIDPDRADEARESILHGESWRVVPEEQYGLAETGNDVERMLEEFRRADCVIQAVDIGGLRAAGDQGPPPRPGGRDSLLMMARGTGGELYERFNDLGEAMSRMLQRTSVTYVLAVQPERLQPEGEYHRLRVELRKPVAGARVVHRPGYYLPKPYAEQSSLEKLLEAANQVMSGEESDAVRTSVLAAPFPSGGDKAYVPVLIEVEGSSLLAGQQPSRLPVEVYVYALDGVGAVHDFLTQTVGLDVAKGGAGLREHGFKFFGHVDLQPGDYSLRVMVRNSATGLSGLRVAPLHVPAFASGEAWLSPPLVPDPPNRWLIIREEPRDAAEGTAAPASNAKQPPYPFLLQKSTPFVPSARPALAPGHEVRLALAGANLRSAEWKAEARVTAPDGREVSGPDNLEVLERRAGDGSAPDRAAVRFRPPADLKPGEYLLRVTVTGAVAGTSATSSLRFVVPPPAHGRGDGGNGGRD